MAYQIKLTVIEETDEMTQYGPKKRKDTVVDLGDDIQIMDPQVLAALLRGVADRIAGTKRQGQSYVVNASGMGVGGGGTTYTSTIS